MFQTVLTILFLIRVETIFDHALQLMQQIKTIQHHFCHGIIMFNFNKILFVIRNNIKKVSIRNNIKVKTKLQC